jgi:predicted ATPase
VRLLAEAMQLAEDDRRRLFASQTSDGRRQRPLPTPADRLFGRQAEVAALSRLLKDGTRLVTVSGPGGVGKTRTAIAAASQVSEGFADGVSWLPVGSVNDRGSLFPAVAATLGLRPIGSAEAHVIVDHVRDQQLLLVIDNAEHLLPAVAALCAAIIAGAPAVAILITSRHHLQIASERVFELHPLEVPAPGSALDDLARVPASRLFLDRAHRLASSEMDDTEIAAVVRICQRLDGLPLALELAAARTNVLAITQLAATLDESLMILQPAADDESLTEAAVGWTYRLLSPVEQAFFARLSVFAAQFSLESATSVCAEDLGPLVALDALSSLVAKSLVYRTQDAGGQAQFRLLQVIREFASARLAEASDAKQTEARHARYVLDLVQRAAPELTGHDQQRWLTTLDREVTEIRRAVIWSIANEPENAQRMVGALWRWCYLRGRYAEGRAWAAEALAAAPHSPADVRAAALSGAGMLAFLQCEYDLAARQIETARVLYGGLDDSAGVAWCLSRLGSIARERGEYDTAEALHREALALIRRTKNAHEMGTQLNLLAFVAWLRGDFDAADDLGARALEVMTAAGDQEGVAWALINAGATARYRGDLAGAQLLLRQSLELSEEIAFREGVAWSLNQLGVIARLHGKLEQARSLQLDSLAEHRELGDRWRQASVLDEVAAGALAAGDLTEAAARLAAADRLRREIDTPVPLVERAVHEETLAACRATLGPTYDAAALAGMLLTDR